MHFSEGYGYIILSHCTHASLHSPTNAHLCTCLQYAGDPVSLTISEAVLSVVEEEELAAHAQELGKYIRTQLRDMAKNHPCIGDVRYFVPGTCTIT